MCLWNNHLCDWCHRPACILNLKWSPNVKAVGLVYSCTQPSLFFDNLFLMCKGSLSKCVLVVTALFQNVNEQKIIICLLPCQDVNLIGEEYIKVRFLSKRSWVNLLAILFFLPSMYIYFLSWSPTAFYEQWLNENGYTILLRYTSCVRPQSYLLG